VGFVVMALVIAIILLISNQLRLKAKKNRLEKKTLEQELDFKKKELILNVLSLMKQNEMFADISRKILQYEGQVQNPETLEILNTIGSKVRKSNEKQGLKEFSLRFKEIHKDFYDTLLSKFPNLTPNELRLCAFLKLNMTSKEISELTGQQLNTLEHARYILRQKLNISNSDVNLITFLAQI
jgi:DNA-binding CsgD family transcriptional regulator